MLTGGPDKPIDEWTPDELMAVDLSPTIVINWDDRRAEYMWVIVQKPAGDKQLHVLSGGGHEDYDTAMREARTELATRPWEQ